MTDSPRAQLEKSIDKIVSACRSTFREELHCVILKGSIVTGDFIPGYSDIDIHAYVEDRILEEGKVPKLEYALKFQEAVGQLKPEDAGVSQFEVYFLPADGKREGWNPPVPGTFRILYGYPVPAMKMPPLKEYLENEWKYLAEVRRRRLDIIGKFVDKPDSSLPALVRLTGTCLKGFIYALYSVMSKNPERASPLDQLLCNVCIQVPDLSCAVYFFQTVRNWSTLTENSEQMRKTFAYGIRALEAIERWILKNHI